MRLLPLPVLLLLLPAAGLPTRAVAQPVRLEIHPRAGDTISMRLDQSSELTGTRRVGGAESSNSVVSGMRVFTRAIVEVSSGKVATVLAITDSVFLSTTDRYRSAPGSSVPMQLRGMRVHMRVFSDGVVEMAGDDPQGNAAELLSLMPASLPRGAVSVGESWTSEMVLPSTNPLGAPAGRVRARFRLDSLRRGGALAYVSMRGELQPAARPGTDSRVPVVQRGTLTGSLLLDRTRGWLTETRFEITVYSTLAPPASSEAAPMRFVMRVRQRMETLDRR